MNRPRLPSRSPDLEESRETKAGPRQFKVGRAVPCTRVRQPTLAIHQLSVKCLNSASQRIKAGQYVGAFFQLAERRKLFLDIAPVEF